MHCAASANLKESPAISQHGDLASFLTIMNCGAWFQLLLNYYHY